MKNRSWKDYVIQLVDTFLGVLIGLLIFRFFLGD
jgi:hypothetical protein